MKLDGWHRLWIVACAIYLAAVGVFLTSRWPKLEDINDRGEFRARLAPESHAKLSSPSWPDSKDLSECTKISDRGKALECFRAMSMKGPGVKARVMPNRHVLYFSLDTSQEEVEKIASEYLAVLKSENLKRKGKSLLYAGLWWIIPCLLVYVVGLSITWIYAGFKSR